MRTAGAIREIARLAAAQHGCITRRQARSVGLSESQVDRRCRTGALIPLHRDVYAVGHVPQVVETTWMAAVLALGPGAHLSHQAAARLWGLSDRRCPVHVTVPSNAGFKDRDGIRVHRAGLGRGDVARRRGIPVTSLERTLSDLAGSVDARVLASAFEEAQVRHRLEPRQIMEHLDRNPGRRGNARLRVLAEGAVDPGAVRSVLELRFLRLCAEHDLPRPLVNARVGPWRPDFLWPHHALVVETDGRRFHRSVAKRDRDARKDAYFKARGCTVLRLDWAEVTAAPERVAEAVGRALAARFTASGT